MWVRWKGESVISRYLPLKPLLKAYLLIQESFYKMIGDIPEEIIALCNQVTAKRARTVIDHIIAHGSITTEDLKNIYGYDHPPRAIRDVREHGIPLITFKVTSSTTGRKIAAYKFDV